MQKSNLLIDALNDLIGHDKNIVGDSAAPDDNINCEMVHPLVEQMINTMSEMDPKELEATFSDMQVQLIACMTSEMIGLVEAHPFVQSRQVADLEDPNVEPRIVLAMDIIALLDILQLALMSGIRAIGIEKRLNGDVPVYDAELDALVSAAQTAADILSVEATAHELDAARIALNSALKPYVD